MKVANLQLMATGADYAGVFGYICMINKIKPFIRLKRSILLPLRHSASQRIFIISLTAAFSAKISVV
jgi:hypothetical protein